ncbi:MAG TPA: hypothetical protein VHM88_26705 [Candidatus Acidoferrales bacterium]|nr:hypothetical protein [Candidatus Acidoferrales bacterium]
MKRILAVLILAAPMTLATAAAFAENNSAMDRQPPRNVTEQPVAITPNIGVVSGAPGQYNGPWYEWRLDNRDSHAGR